MESHKSHSGVWTKALLGTSALCIVICFLLFIAPFYPPYSGYSLIFEESMVHLCIVFVLLLLSALALLFLAIMRENASPRILS